MPLIQRTDSDGVLHQFWEQELGGDCALASAWTAICLAKLITTKEDEVALGLSIYWREDILREHFKRDDGGGMYPNQVVDKLREAGLRADYTNSTTVDISRVSSDGHPAIVGLWHSFQKKSEGHAIVATRINSKGQVVYLDPWGFIMERPAGPIISRPDGAWGIRYVTYVSQPGKVRKPPPMVLPDQVCRDPVQQSVGGPGFVPTR